MKKASEKEFVFLSSKLAVQQNHFLYEIQLKNYKENFLTWAPKLIIPIWKAGSSSNLFLITIGPPESPWQALLPLKQGQII